jgi:outer membrane receptor protein involved in Fe transport
MSNFSNALTGGLFVLFALPSTGWCEGKQTSHKTKDSAATSDKAAGTEDDPVVIKGKRSLNKIDRQVYDVSKDPQNETGTAAETLQKIPGVSVDASGEVSLRGNGVQILVNGKPSPLLAGDNRGAALRAMPSGMISSIEVMSNPGAQYGSSGAGGIINIVTKKINLPGSFGNLDAQLSSTGGGRLDGFVQLNRGRFATSAFFSASEDHTAMTNALSQSELNSDGEINRSTGIAGKSVGVSRSVFTNASVDYDLGATDTLTGLFNFMTMSNRSRTSGETNVYDVTTLTDQYNSQGLVTFGNNSGTLGLTLAHIGKALGETLKVDAKVTHATNQFDGDNILNYTVSTLPENLGLRQMSNGSQNRTTTVNLGADYNTFIGDDQVSAGLQIDQDDARNQSLVYSPYTTGSETPAANPLLTTVFTYRQTIAAAYVTYQKAFGDHWAVLAGIRAEAMDYESPEATSRTPIKVSYTNINPSLFATYIVSDAAKVRLNYSHRLQRPTPSDLNPSLMYVNAQTVIRGAPALRPQEINSFEAAYEYTKLMSSYSVRAYRLDNSKVINPVTTIITDPLDAGNQVIQISRRNAGSSHQTGLQFTYSNMPTQRWSVNGSANIYSTRMRVPGLPGERSQTTASGQISVSYRPTDKDALSFSYNRTGRQLTGDGYASGYASGSLYYSRNLTSAITLTIRASDILKSKETLSVSNTGSVRRVSSFSQRAPTFFIGIGKRFSSGSFAFPN